MRKTTTHAHLGAPAREHETGGAGPARRLLGGFERRTWWLIASFVVLCHAFWQGHGVFDAAFRNPDVAGIAYNARLLLSGELPYVASRDIKPPGAFFLFAPWLALGGMRAVWGAAVLWGAALSLGAGILAELVWGRGAGPRAAVLHALCAAVASDADINYSFWMAAPFTLSAACACHAVRVGDPKRSSISWALSGALAMLAVAIKPSAWPLILLDATLLLRVLWTTRSLMPAVRGALAGAGGAAAVAGLIALPYAVSGQLGALVGGLRDVSSFGAEYVAAVREPYGGRLPAILRGLPCLAEQMPGMIALAAAGLGAPLARDRPRAPLAIAAYVFLVAAFIGTTFTLRFFSHDNAQLWPALAVMAVRPAGLLGRLLDGARRGAEQSPLPRGVAVLVAPAITLFVGGAAAWPGFEQRWGYMHWMAERDHEVHAICEALAPRLPEREPVLAWGWSAWSVYEHCQRRSPGRVFKVIASVTSVNTNTCNNGFGPMVLRKDTAPRAFLDDVRRRPPSLVLWSSYFQEMGGDPLDGWSELRTFLRERYLVVEARGPFVALLRSDLAGDAPERTAQRGSSPVPSGSGVYGWSGRAGSVWTKTSRTPGNLPLMASMTQCVTR